ncbi:hypothetical protein GCM10027343_19790 [Noviherbaspirillum agri]
MYIKQASAWGGRQRGISLIETILFIVIVGVGVAGLASVMSSTVKHSADPMIRKQALAVAESLLEEIMLQPFTTCDPDAYDPASGTCAAVEALGPETISGVKEARHSVDNPFDNVSDYHGFKMDSGIFAVTDGTQKITGLGDYKAEVRIAEVGNSFGLAGAADASRALKINVQVTQPDGETITLTGYRFRYSPTP